MSGDNSTGDNHNDDHCGALCSGACLDYGDTVEHKMNTNVFGIVVAREGSTLHVQLSPSLAIGKFQECTLRLLTDDDEYVPPISEERDNVVSFPGVRLTADTTTKGVA